MKKNPLPLLNLFIFLFFLCINFTNSFSQWDIPAEYKTMKNPVKKSESALSLGKEQYNKHCAGCHGTTGKGDGEKAKSFANVTPANLSLDKFVNETDGEHFYKIKIGRNNLHSFKSKIDDEATWSIIHYMKTFGK
jgi:mono/diheme cytochrome c family protein